MVGFVVGRHVDDCRRAFRVGERERERESLLCRYCAVVFQIGVCSKMRASLFCLTCISYLIK